MNEAFAMAEPGKTIGEKDFQAIYSAIIAQQHFSYNEQFSRYSEKQKSLLQALALEGSAGANITSNAFLSKYTGFVKLHPDGLPKFDEIRSYSRN